MDNAYNRIGRVHAHARMRLLRAFVCVRANESWQSLVWNLASLFLREVTSETSLFAALLTCYIPPSFMLPFNQELRILSYLKTRRTQIFSSFFPLSSILFPLITSPLSILFCPSITHCRMIHLKVKCIHLKFLFCSLFFLICLTSFHITFSSCSLVYNVYVHIYIFTQMVEKKLYEEWEDLRKSF